MSIDVLHGRNRSARTRGARTERTYAETELLPASIETVAANLRGVVGDRTDDGGTLLMGASAYLADYIGRALQFTMTLPFLRREEAIDNDPAPHLTALRWIKATTGLSQARLGRLLGVSRQTLNLWEHDRPIADENRRRLLAVYEVLQRVWRRHPSRTQMQAWLDTPRGDDERTPAELLEANEINRVRLLAMTTSSPKVSRPPAWAQRPASPAFRRGAEGVDEAVPLDRDAELIARFGLPGGDEDEDG